MVGPHRSVHARRDSSAVGAACQARCRMGGPSGITDAARAPRRVAGACARGISAAPDPALCGRGQPAAGCEPTGNQCVRACATAAAWPAAHCDAASHSPSMKPDRMMNTGR